MNNAPTVSVIMPAYNAESTLMRAVLSVIHQTFTDWQLLIIDDASTDNTLSIAKKISAEDLRISVVSSRVNQGAAASRNKGIQQCKGAYVAFIDSDDIWCPEKLDRQLKLITKTGADLCYTAYALVNLAGDKVRADYCVPEHTSYEELLCENVIGCSTVLLSAALSLLPIRLSSIETMRNSKSGGVNFVRRRYTVLPLLRKSHPVINEEFCILPCTLRTRLQYMCFSDC